MDNKNERIELPGGYCLEIRTCAYKEWDVYVSILSKAGDVLFQEKWEDHNDLSMYRHFAAAMKPTEVSRTAEESYQWGVSKGAERGRDFRIELMAEVERLKSEVVEAELRGARKMQDAVAQMVETHAITQNGKYTKVVDAPPKDSSFERSGSAVRALKPEEVIK